MAAKILCVALAFVMLGLAGLVAFFGKFMSVVLEGSADDKGVVWVTVVAICLPLVIGAVAILLRALSR